MSFLSFDVDAEYQKDDNLRKLDVEMLVEWADKHPYLPKINDAQAILFLQSCYFNNEIAKHTIEKFFTMKTIYSEVFLGRNPLHSPLREALNIALQGILPRKTPEGYTIYWIKYLDLRAEKFHLPLQIKHFDMAFMLHLYQNGTSNGHLIVFDMAGLGLSHFIKLSLFNMKKYVEYVQEALPIRLKGFHFLNVVPFMDKVMGLAKPFMKKELLKLFHYHTRVHSLLKHIPRHCLPQDYGGDVSSVLSLHEKTTKNILNNCDLFDWEDTLLINKSRRRSSKSMIGSQGTFKTVNDI